MYNNRSFNSDETQATPAFMLMSKVLSDNCSVYSRDHSFTQVICLNAFSYKKQRVLFEKIFNPKYSNGLKIKLVTQRDFAEQKKSFQSKYYIVVQKILPKSEKGLSGVLEAAMKLFNKDVVNLCDNIKNFDPQVLSNGSGEYSDLLSFWSSLYYNTSKSVPPIKKELEKCFVQCQINFNGKNGLISHTSSNKKIYSSILNLKLFRFYQVRKFIQNLLGESLSFTIFHHKNTNRFQYSPFLETISVLLKSSCANKLKDIQNKVNDLSRDHRIDSDFERHGVEWLWMSQFPGYHSLI